MRYRSLVVFIAVVGDKSHKSEEIVRPIGILLHLSIHLNIIVLIRISPISVIRSIINVNIMVISHKCDHQDLCMQEELPKNISFGLSESMPLLSVICIHHHDCSTLSAISGGRISRRVVAAKRFIELFLIGPRGRSAYLAHGNTFATRYPNRVYLGPNHIHNIWNEI